MQEKSILPQFMLSDDPQRDWVLTIGNFDGFHLGHQALINRVMEEKKRLGANGGLITFSPHPKEVLQPATPLSKIFDEETKWKISRESGLDAAFIIPFTRDFSRLSPEEFVGDFLFSTLNIKKIIVGYDFNFGKKRKGSTHLLQELVEKQGAQFEKLPPVKWNDIPVSSSMIRQFLFEADFYHAEQFLGREWSINGIVKEGKRLGREIGFPTMNIYPEIVIPVSNGVYCCGVEVEGKRFSAVCNIGLRPTFKGKTVVVEAHLLDYQGDAYGKSIRVFPEKLIREEIRFDSVESLQKQIREDSQIAKRYFAQKTAVTFG